MSENCNCPWLGCSEHHGVLCANEAIGVKCENCDDIHYNGGVFAEGIHLCAGCLVAARALLKDDLFELMNVVLPAVPPELEALHNAIRYFYLARSDGESWQTPINDAQAVIGLIACIAHRLSRDQAEDVDDYLKRFISFKSAYSPDMEVKNA